MQSIFFIQFIINVFFIKFNLKLILSKYIYFMKNLQIKKIALKFLQEKEHITAVVATATKDGTPHSAVVYYFVDENFNFYFLTEFSQFWIGLRLK